MFGVKLKSFEKLKFVWGVRWINFLKILAKILQSKVCQTLPLYFKKTCKCKRLTVFDLHVFLYVYLFAFQLNSLNSLEKSQWKWEWII